VTSRCCYVKIINYTVSTGLINSHSIITTPWSWSPGFLTPKPVVSTFNNDRPPSPETILHRNLRSVSLNILLYFPFPFVPLRRGTFPLYFPSKRKVCCGFLSPLKIHRLGWVLNPQPLGPVASTLTTTPPRRLVSYLDNIKVPRLRRADSNNQMRQDLSNIDYSVKYFIHKINWNKILLSLQNFRTIYI
jgi:hypothetical protein